MNCVSFINKKIFKSYDKYFYDFCLGALKKYFKHKKCFCGVGGFLSEDNFGYNNERWVIMWCEKTLHISYKPEKKKKIRKKRLILVLH